jgi:hypothetical protein
MIGEYGGALKKNRIEIPERFYTVKRLATSVSAVSSAT